MYCEHIWNRDFIYYHNSQLDYNLKRTYKRLINFIQNFFKREFMLPDIVDLSLVEINRIDLAFNQVFEDKQAALQYLEYQKKIRKKNIRVNSNNFRDYETSLMYITKRYSLKIYHKGTEYARNDIKEHEKINKEKNMNILIYVVSIHLPTVCSDTKLLSVILCCLIFIIIKSSVQNVLCIKPNMKFIRRLNPLFRRMIALLIK